MCGKKWWSHETNWKKRCNATDHIAIVQKYFCHLKTGSWIKLFIWPWNWSIFRYSTYPQHIVRWCNVLSESCTMSVIVQSSVNLASVRRIDTDTDTDTDSDAFYCWIGLVSKMQTFRNNEFWVWNGCATANAQKNRIKDLFSHTICHKLSK